VVVGISEQGRLALVDEAKRLEALALVREGRLYDLGRVLDEHAPVFPGRYFRQTLARNPGEPLGENEVNWVWDVFTGTTQLGTHLDALSHLYVGERGYGGVTLTEVCSPSGVVRHGAETIPQIVTRGWLVDASPLGAGDVIGVDALAEIEPAPGDAVFFHTGWGSRWGDAETYLSGEPGPGYAIAEWLVERGVALTGCDTWSYGPVPAENPARPFDVPQTLNVEHGVFVVENLDLAELARAGVREFCLVLTLPKLRGATGAWVSPIALV
jgi:kynurenine formamidase